MEFFDFFAFLGVISWNLPRKSQLLKLFKNVLGGRGEFRIKKWSSGGNIKPSF